MSDLCHGLCSPGFVTFDLPEGASPTEVWLGEGDEQEVSHYLCYVENDEYWCGPLDVGIWGATQDRYVRIVTVAATIQINGIPKPVFNVFLSQHESITTCDEQEAPGDADHHGQGHSLEVAWRFALGLVYGPADDMYDEDRLHRWFAQYLDPAPDHMTPHNLERWLAT